MKKRLFSLIAALALTVSAMTVLSLSSYAKVGDDWTDEDKLSKIVAYRYDDIVIDGKADAAWQYADSREVVTQFGDSITTATIKVLYGDKSIAGIDANKALFFLLEIDKHGVTVSEFDAAFIGVCLDPFYNGGNDLRDGEKFGIGIIGMLAGDVQQDYGWFPRYRPDEIKSAMTTEGQDKWILEGAVDIVDANGTNRMYEHGEETGFGIGTQIAISVLVNEGTGTLPENEGNVGVGWNITNLASLVYPNSFVYIGEELEMPEDEATPDAPATTPATGEEAAPVTSEDAKTDSDAIAENTGAEKTENKETAPKTADTAAVIATTLVLAAGCVVLAKKKHR